MERTQIFELMSELKLYGMKTAYDEIMATGIKRQHEPPRIVGDLLQAEVSEKQARSIRYQIAIAKLPLAKDLDDFQFAGAPINERLVRDLAQSDFLSQQRNCVLVGGTGAGKTHLAIAIARHCIRAGKRGRFYNTVDLVNRLEAEARGGRQGRIAEYLIRKDFVVLDELGYLPFAQTGGQLLFNLISQLYERTSRDHQSRIRRMAKCFHRRQDDQRAAGSFDPSLRHHRDRERQLAPQEPGITPMRSVDPNRSAPSSLPTSSPSRRARRRPGRSAPAHAGDAARHPGPRLRAPHDMKSVGTKECSPPQTKEWVR